VTDESNLSGRYASVLRSYLDGDGETALHAAYQLGREALEGGLGPLVLFSIHRDVVNGLSVLALDQAELTREVTTVFIETLAPFQMAYAGLDEARGAVADLGSLIHRQATELDVLDAQLDDVSRTADTLRRLRSMIERHHGELDSLRARLEQFEQTADARRKEMSNIVSAQEQERRRLAGEIHDDALQAMAAVLIRLGIVSRRLAEPEQRAVIEQLETTTRDAISRLRRLLAGLQPHELDRAGLATAVRSSLEQLEADFAIGSRLEDMLDAEPGPEVRTIAFRIIQEALANTRKHANASHIDILLQSRDEGLLARVTDNGVGFDVGKTAQHAQPGHLGIPAMRERARLAGGWLTMSSKRGETSVEVWIPDTTAGSAE
jgi:signal transduction histidine kinase